MDAKQHKVPSIYEEGAIEIFCRYCGKRLKRAKKGVEWTLEESRCVRCASGEVKCCKDCRERDVNPCVLHRLIDELRNDPWIKEHVFAK